MIRTAGAPLDMIAPIRAAIEALGADVAIDEIATMEQKAAASYAAPRFYATMIGLFAGFAILLAAVGLYGTVASTVTQRTREIGLYMALGARGAQVKTMFVRRALGAVLMGVALGGAGSVLVIRIVERFLYGMDPVDPLTFLAVAALLVTVTIVASYVPARHATRVDPLVALRSD